tara:strand:+ start:215 stop:565 length:351 start_codon:yes stop_codon:yes gene_type:complete
MRVNLTLEAKSDITEVVKWYRERSVRVAGDFLNALTAAFDRIEAQPTAQVIVDAATGARRALLRKFPHRVLYLIDEDRIVVFAVMHHRRNDPAWRERIKDAESAESEVDEGSRHNP